MEDLLKSKGRKPKKGKVISCSRCKKAVYRAQSWVDREFKKAFCSRECRVLDQRETGISRKIICSVCQKLYYRTPSQERLRGKSMACSKICKGKLMKGKNNPDWKGGKAAKKMLWRLFSLYIRQRDNGTCISCGKQDYWRKTDAGHYVPKSAGMSLYFDERNVNCQCTYCNRYMHGNLSRYAIAMRQKYGETILEELEEERKKLKKYTPSEYQELIEKYRKILKEEYPNTDKPGM